MVPHGNKSRFIVNRKYKRTSRTSGNVYRQVSVERARLSPGWLAVESITVPLENKYSMKILEVCP